MDLPDGARSDTVRLLQSVKPTSLLLASADTALIEAVRAALATTQIDITDADSLGRDVDSFPVYDVVVLAGILEQLDKPLAERLIGRLRDLHSRHLFLLVRTGDGQPDQQSHWRRTDLLAYGFSLHRRYPDKVHDRLDWHLCRFELDTYKSTPEWLNSQYWANPELFDKFRW